MPVKNNQRIVVYLLAFELVFNIAIRYFSNAVYVYGNIISLLILAACAIIISEGVNRSLAILALGCVASIGIDTLAFTPYLFEANDWLFITAWVVATFDYWWHGGKPYRLNANSVILLLMIAIKLYSQNSMEAIGERSIYYIGDALTHFLFGLFFIRLLLRNYVVVPVLLFAATFINLQDNTVGDPYNLHAGEIAVMALVVIDLIWWKLRERYADTPERKQLFLHIFIAMQIFIVGALLMVL